MANLPKIRRGQGRGRGPADEPRADRASPDVQRLEAHGLTWLNIESPTQLETAWLAEHYDFHPLDLEDVLSRRRQRAKIDEYPDYLFIVLHFPRFDKRAGRLQAAELNLFVMRGPRHHAPQRAAQAAQRRLVALRAQRDGARAADEQGLGLPALRDRRRDVRLLLPDPRQDRLQARRDRGRAVRGRERRPGPRHLEHQAGDHQLPPHREAAADHAAPARPQQPALRAPGPRHLLRRHRRQERAHLGPPGELQGGRRGARRDERVGDLAPRERHPARADRDQRDRAAADPDRERLRDERRAAGRAAIRPAGPRSRSG